MTDITINRIGLGSWAIGGPCMDNGTQMGWGSVDDGQSVRAIRSALELGVNYIDTANIYGAGHSEEVIGRAVRGMREKVVISTKFGILCDPALKCTTGIIQTPADIRISLEGSLRRLDTDYIDLFLFHLGECTEEFAVLVREELEALTTEGKIRCYGWSTQREDLARIFAEGEHCAAFMHIENVFEDYPEMLSLSERTGAVSLCRSPLCMGLLTGKYDQNSRFSTNDLRGKNAPPWMHYFVGGKPNPEMLRRLEAIRDILTSNGRTLAQGCLAWIWARSKNTVPVPGFRTEQQAKENAGSLAAGPLTEDEMRQIGEVFGRKEEEP